MKLHFNTDYMRGAHPKVMERLVETNMQQTVGYGEDDYTLRAKKLILEKCGISGGDVVFLVGGTQTNSFVIDALLKHHQGVLAAESAHINVHEAGAIEATGHKVLTLPSHKGKLLAYDIDKYITNFYADDTFQHMVAPGMVYISYPTEYGTLYSKDELKDLNRICKKWEIPLYLDGARLGYGLAAQSEVTLEDLARLCDVFYIGGTKVGALFGEAVVLKTKNYIKDIVPLVKQHGALLAKGRLLGIQFETLFTDNLYHRISENAVKTALKLKEGFKSYGFETVIDSPTNQQFLKLPNNLVDILLENVTFEFWGPKGEKETIVRFVTDWATTENDIDLLISFLEKAVTELSEA